jgi:hypothetical protein
VYVGGQPLIPVVAELLHLSAEEVKQLRDAVQAGHSAAATAAGLGTLSSWLAFG